MRWWQTNFKDWWTLDKELKILKSRTIQRTEYPLQLHGGTNLLQPLAEWRKCPLTTTTARWDRSVWFRDNPKFGKRPKNRFLLWNGLKIGQNSHKKARTAIKKRETGPKVPNISTELPPTLTYKSCKRCRATDLLI